MIWRKEALVSVGDLVEEYRGSSMLTEDFALAVKSRLKGYDAKCMWIDTGEWVPGSLVANDAMCFFSVFDSMLKVRSLFRFIKNTPNGWRTTQKSIEDKTGLVKLISIYWLTFTLLLSEIGGNYFISSSYIPLSRVDIWPYFFALSQLPFIMILGCFFLFYSAVTFYEEHLMDTYRIEYH
ncbi:MAG: hypothetical protein OXE99_01875 [Cellvibrionales bacterium]|nr:hypothetical protein [Cellvibrionales bacterium]